MHQVKPKWGTRPHNVSVVNPTEELGQILKVTHCTDCTGTTWVLRKYCSKYWVVHTQIFYLYMTYTKNVFNYFSYKWTLRLSYKVFFYIE